MADGTGGGVLIGGVLAVLGARWVWNRLLYPVRVCPPCKGTGEIVSPDGKRVRPCSKCGSTGRLQ